VLADHARSLIRQARFTEAEATLRRCLEMDAHHGECRRLYSSVLMQLGQPERAKQQFDEYMRNPPTERPTDMPSSPRAPSKPLNSFGGSAQNL
jgi:hypothetical protein